MPYFMQIEEIRYSSPGLNLTLDIWAAIYLNQITTWNDIRIQEINPLYASILPNRSIVVVLNTNPSTLTRIITLVLSDISEEFNSQVGITDVPTKFPVMSRPGGVSLIDDDSDIVNTLNSLNDGFSVVTSGELATAKNADAFLLQNQNTKEFLPATQKTILTAMLNYNNSDLLQIYNGSINSTYSF